MTSITLEQFYKHRHKEENKIIPEQLKEFLEIMKEKEIENQHSRQMGRHSTWKRVNSGIKRNWLIEKKFNQTDTERLCSQYRAVLNKLNKNNFKQLLPELLELDIKNSIQLTALVNEIFKKAISEPSFCSLYSKVCVELLPCYIEEHGIKVLFRELLLNKVQKSFEKYTSFSTEEELKEEYVSKKEILGCITFIGELYNNHIITDKIIIGCFYCMWLKIGQGKLYIIDSICKLMMVVGNNFRKNRPDKEKEVFNKLAAIKDSNTISQKEKFEIMDLFDEREKWD